MVNRSSPTTLVIPSNCVVKYFSNFMNYPKYFSDFMNYTKIANHENILAADYSRELDCSESQNNCE